jgi:hypothetical protein
MADGGVDGELNKDIFALRFDLSIVPLGDTLGEEQATAQRSITQ